MTKEQFFNGESFAVFGLPFDMRFDARTEKLECFESKTNKVSIQSCVEFPECNEPHFTAFLPVFGCIQPIMIDYAYCELK
jgi:hypothetical protein